MPPRDPEKRKRTHHRYYIRHIEARKQYSHDHYVKNIERSRAYGRIHSKQYYATHHKQVIDSMRIRKQERTEELNEYKRNLKCSMCGQSFPDCPAVIDFHHTGDDPKTDGIGQLMQRRVSRKRIQAEIAKCIPLCANCHRKMHYLEKQKSKGV